MQQSGSDCRPWLAATLHPAQGGGLCVLQVPKHCLRPHWCNIIHPFALCTIVLAIFKAMMLMMHEPTVLVLCPLLDVLLWYSIWTSSQLTRDTGRWICETMHWSLQTWMILGSRQGCLLWNFERVRATTSCTVVTDRFRWSTSEAALAFARKE